MLEGNQHVYYTFDLEQIENIKSFIEKIIEENGKLDGLVYCAGLMTMRKLSLTTCDFTQEMMRVNVLAFIEMVRIITKKRNCKYGGSIVAISSIGSIRGDKAKTAYCATKGALDSAIQALAIELGETQGIRVNTVNPGWVKGEVYDKYIEITGVEKAYEIEQRQILKIAEANEITNVIAFLLSSSASYITGQSIVVDGGFTIRSMN